MRLNSFWRIFRRSYRVCIRQTILSSGTGSFTCACNDGYAGDGVSTCDDIDECNAEDVCDSNAKSFKFRLKWQFWPVKKIVILALKLN